MNLRSSHEQTAWDRFYASAMESGCAVDIGAEFADAMIVERRKRTPKGTESLPIAEVIALRGLATQVKLALAGEPHDLLTTYNRLEAARKKAP